MKCFCSYCNQKLEFPPEMCGIEVDCPTCGSKTLLPPIGQSLGMGRINEVADMWFKRVCVVAYLALAAYGLKSCLSTPSDGYSTVSSHGAGVKHWEDTLRAEDRKINGMKTETDEEIHRDAEMLQHEQDEGISPAGMMQRELEGKHDQQP